MSKTTIIITGASGFIGNALVAHFAEKGWEVRALVRVIPSQHKIKNVDYITFDLTSELSDAVFENADYLVHAAYIKQDGNHPDAYEQNMRGTEALLAKSRQHKLKRIVFLSSMSANSEAVSVYGKQKYELEKLFVSNNETVVRPGLVIGYGGLFQQTVRFMRSKHFVPIIGSGDQPLQIIADYDLVKIIEVVITKNLKGTFAAGSIEVYSYREFYDTIRRVLHIKAWLIPIPLVLLLGAIRTLRLLHIPIQFTEDNLLGLKKLRYFDTLDDLNKLGVTLDSLEETLSKLDTVK